MGCYLFERSFVTFLGWTLLLGGHHGKVFTSVCPIPSSASEEQASRALQGPVLAIPPPCAGHPRAVIAQRHMWCETEDFSRGLIPTPVPHRADAQGHAVFRGLLSEQMCNAMKLWNVLKTYGKRFPHHVLLSRKWHFPWLKSWQSTHSVDTGQKSVAY